MNYARNALESLRYAGIDDYQALTDSERSKLTELFGDWTRITAEQNARLAALAEDAQAEAERQAARAKVHAHQATLEDVYCGLGGFARRELSAYLAEDADFDAPLDTWLSQLSPPERAKVTALVATI
ncbi:hypothetical protein [Imhoffiella purpurea]|uniref:Uncharacterized protein n=1 Tax=Imhoffiella purpurea TaxID=1249627 RepID=W9VBI6_9GAMM|nr:hypothetical protein [Imhoffiella purpurea]EXJ16943.1 hypothetical protein D779_1766 [Imhoffiella purpurea]